jgi:NACHT domain
VHTGRDQLLSKLQSVAMDEYNRFTCLPKTRLDVIKSITEWIADQSNNAQKVLWLYGLAGSGKSTLSTTIARIMRDLHRLGAFFFFNRDIPERNAATIIRSLAYQLALFDPGIGAEISRIVENNQNIAGMPLKFQFGQLLSAKALSSVEWSGGPIVLVIDALDECGSEADRKILLQALSEGFAILPPFIRVILTSRQERDIEDAFASHRAVDSYNLDVRPKATQEDISEFLQHHLAEIRRVNNRYIRFESDWPGDDKVRALSQCASGLFVWASTAILYIDSHDPRLRLDELIRQQSVASSSNPFANLDRLYRTGLQSAGKWTDPLFCSDCCDIFGVIVCARIPLSCAAIDSLLASPRSCLQSISRLRCFLRGDETDAVRMLHPSFHDYLSSRSRGEAWFIDIEQHNENLATNCINLLNESLRENICGFKLPHPVSNETLSEAVSYACSFWVEHVCMIIHITDRIGERIYEFLREHLLHWIEAMAILKSHGNTIRSLQYLLSWLQVCCPT